MAVSSFDPVKWEPEVLEFWRKNKIYDKIMKKLAKAPKYFFLDGPPYTSGAIHIGQAWNYSLKDSYRRYLRMSGINVNDTPGFDMHGLPIEKKVEAKLKISNKQEIITKIGVEKFIRECEKFAYEKMQPMITDLQKLGICMNWDEPYTTPKNEYIEGAWWALKQAWKNGFLYQGFKVTTWCPQCSTSLAKHELEYETSKDNAIFVKFPIVGKKNEFLLVWTTTPWTIPFNLAVMANPNMDYVKAKSDNETLILAKDLVEKVFSELKRDYKIIENLKGSALEGTHYKHPLADDIPKLKEISKLKWAHKVILSEKYVSNVDGTGLVHCAPGCGPEDFEVGQKYGLPAFNELNENGIFSKDMGPFAGLTARTDDAKFIKDFETRGMLAGITKYEHEYAKCWRCHNDIVYRATKQWFLATTKLKDEMLKGNQNVYWTPDWAGQKWFESWLENLQDWNISRQRFWGIPLPIWMCSKCPDFILVESADELKKLGGKVPKDLHKPWIDEVILRCPKCKSEMRRVPDVMDVWLDSGASPWASTGDKEAVADFILEGKDQIRGWFNSLMSLSMVARKKVPYKSVYMHGFIQDAQGRKMSKSLGNVILPSEVTSKYGADSFRFYAIGAAKPGLDLNYNIEDTETKRASLLVLWNTHVYLLEAAKLADINPTKLKPGKFEAEDLYMLSRLNSTILKVTELFKKHYLNEIPWAIESLFLELSRWYIKAVRERAGEEAVLYVIYRTLFDSIRLLTPITPFIAEKIYQNLKEEFRLKEDSVYLLDWPIVDDKQIDSKLEAEIAYVKDILSNILAIRDKIPRGIRWPIKTAVLISENEELKSAAKEHSGLIRRLANILNVEISHELKGLRHKVKADFSKVGPKFGRNAAEVVAKVAATSAESVLRQLNKEKKFTIDIAGKKVELEHDDIIIEEIIPAGVTGGRFGSYSLYVETEETQEMLQSGFVREFTRAVQALRKKANLQKSDRIALFVSAPASSQAALQNQTKEIAQKVGASSIDFVSAKIVEAKKSKDRLSVKNFEANFGF